MILSIDVMETKKTIVSLSLTVDTYSVLINACQHRQKKQDWIELNWMDWTANRSKKKYPIDVMVRVNETTQ